MRVLLWVMTKTSWKVFANREYGWKKRYVSHSVGQNARMDELQAAALRIKLKHLDDAISCRRLIAKTYTEL